MVENAVAHATRVVATRTNFWMYIAEIQPKPSSTMGNST
jgi:hypothetical protein